MQRPPSQSNTQAPHQAQPSLPPPPPPPHVGGAQPATAATAGDNISVSNPFDDPVGAGSGPAGASSANASGSPTPRPPYQQQTAGSAYPPPPPPPVSRPSGAPYPGQPGAYGQYGASDQYNATGPPGQFGQNQAQFPPQNRNMYPPYGPEGEAPPPGSNQYGPYGNRPYSQPPPGSSQAPTPPGANAAGPPAPGGPTGAPSGAYPPGAPSSQDYYRPPDQSPQPRRHPDFVKDTQPYPGYNARPQIYGGWQGSNQYRGQYPTAPTWGAVPPRTTAPPGSALGPPNQQASAAAQWEQHRYAPQQAPPPQQQPPYQQPPGQQQPPTPPQWAQMGAPNSTAQTAPTGAPPGSQLRPPMPGQQPPPLPQQQQRMPSSGAPVPGMPPAQQPIGGPPGGMPKPPFTMPPPPQSSTQGPPQGPPVPGGIPPGMLVGSGPPKPMVGSVPSAAPQQQMPGGPPQQQMQPGSFPPPNTNAQLIKKEIIFPPDSVEATTPILYRRKRLTKADVCPIDPWRIFMAMRSGQLAECTWALDVLNVLLFDDSTVQYFGLSHLPGLLTLLLEHFQKNLAEMFDEESDSGIGQILDNDDLRSRQRKRCNMSSICDGSYNRTSKRRCNAANAKSETGNDDPDAASDEEEELDLGQVRVVPNPDERVLLLSQTPNYTLQSRKGMPVRMQQADDDIFVCDNPKKWDTDVSKLPEQVVPPIGSDVWAYEFTTERETQNGIIDVFKSEIINIPFARFIRGKKRSSGKKSVPAETIKTEITVAIKSEQLTESAEDDEADKLQQQAFNKKRRLCNSSSSSKPTTLQPPAATTASEVSPASNAVCKKSRQPTDDTESSTFVEPAVTKREPANEASADTSATDSDCREVDMEIEAPPQQAATTASNKFDPKATVRDPALLLQRRRRDSSFEDECYTRDEASLYLVTEYQDSLARRVICLSSIFRNLTFVPGNETVLAKSTRFLAILGSLLLLNHEHLQRTPKTRNYDREEDTDFSDSCSSLQGEREWWWDYLVHIRENMLVAMANIAGHLELSRYEEIIARPLIDGLLHWAVCPSAHGQDPFPSCGPNSPLSPQRLALEALCKLCVTDANVDLVIATPPHSRLEKLCAVLTRHLCRNEDQVLREFSVNLLHYLAAADSAMARTVALQAPCISYLVAFIEQAEQTALGVANQHGINYLRENPDSMGTSLDMLRRAAGTLLHLAKHPDNRSLFMQQEQRLLGLVMSHILDQQVALIISRVLYQVSRGAGPLLSMEHRMQSRQQQQQEKKQQRQQQQQQQLKNELIKNEATAAAAELTKTTTIKSTNETKESTATTLTTNTVTTNMADESSNSCGQLPPAATLNDVSNSSTNSNSCGTASSQNSNATSNSSSINNNNSHGNHESTHTAHNNINDAAAAATATATATMAAVANYTSGSGGNNEQQHLTKTTTLAATAGFSNTTTTASTMPANLNNSNSNTTSNSNSNNNNSNSNCSSNSNSGSGSGSGSGSSNSSNNSGSLSVAAAVPAAAAPPTPTTPATTTAAVA